MNIKDNVTVYTCDHCNKKLFMKHAMEKHEEKCDKNPKNKKICFGCIHLRDETVEIEVGRDYDGDYITKDSHCFKCEKLNKLMFSWNAEKQNLPEKYPDTFVDQKRMPNDCRHYTEYDKIKYDGQNDLPF